MIPRKPNKPNKPQQTRRRTPTLFLKPTFTIRPSSSGGLDVAVTVQPGQHEEAPKSEPPPVLAFA